MTSFTCMVSILLFIVGYLQYTCDQPVIFFGHLSLGAILDSTHSLFLSAVGAAVQHALRLYTMPDDPAFAMGTGRGHSMDRTFKTVEDVRLACQDDLKSLVIVIAADFAACHSHPFMCSE